MSVTTTHPDYDAHLPEWQMMDDALEGELAIKKSAKYLPKPSGMVEAEKHDSGSVYLYEGYRERAQYEHWVRDSLRTMMGLVSRIVPEIELPTALADLENNATDDGFGLKQLFLRMTRQAISHGRVPLVVNIDDDGRPYFSTYSAGNAINWKAQRVRGRQDLTLAVFREYRDKNDDRYSHERIDVYREFYLQDGLCWTQVLDEKGATIEEAVPLGRVGPDRSLRKGLEYLPIIYCGSTDNSPDVDEVPLLTMARAALKSYQLSADYFTSLHYTSHPQPWVAGMDPEKELSVTGPSAAWDLGPEGSCGYLEFQGAGVEAVRRAMTDQKMAAVEAGAKVIDTGGTESGEARKARQDDQHATLHTIVITVAEAIEQALRYAADWVGAKGDVRFVVKPEFKSTTVDPVVAQQLLQAVMSGKVSADAYWQYLTLGKLPDRTYDEEALHIENPGGVDYGEFA
ncbi:hypothetical protein PAEH1_01445 [Paenalcaligenes hominis]|uniref:DUF4055 domain-containing protein n=1 Tax=Paenalcaligenes hominis TaxID=643674 RepID=A0A1U9JXQ3_9BURK|nr:DUF4055 domain-containing protein [Paenalcaligenes hominis]AQS50544.1 hypothetical protein PAEH1_01445 [Paenalcaligenes hominis]